MKQPTRQNLLNAQVGEVWHLVGGTNVAYDILILERKGAGFKNLVVGHEDATGDEDPVGTVVEIDDIRAFSERWVCTLVDLNGQTTL